MYLRTVASAVSFISCGSFLLLMGVLFTVLSLITVVHSFTVVALNHCDIMGFAAVVRPWSVPSSGGMQHSMGSSGVQLRFRRCSSSGSWPGRSRHLAANLETGKATGSQAYTYDRHRLRPATATRAQQPWPWWPLCAKLKLLDADACSLAAG
eukprot:GHRR01026333.1.p1 GENE.GHRR01026333.1~~GHRR01026333.1.p1  ORF type:complete len:152 (+),score=47.92 GHRR01026333.1:945-1400(+)